MKTTKMLKKNYEFKQVLTKGRSFSGNYIKAFILKNNLNNKYLGLAISTKTGKAFQRNRIKRLIRENYKIVEGNILDGYSVVFLIKKGVNIFELDFNKIEKDMTKILEKSNILKHSK